MPTISEHDALPAGTRLGEFEVQRVLGIGGFGIVYLAFDHALERPVAVKEYMPAALAGRGPGAEVVIRSSAHEETFTLGLRSFINEARLLARFDHPSLVKVYRFWEAHGTAYMVMPYYQGRTLQQVRRELTEPPDEAWLRRLVMPLLGALDCLHREQVYHRDVAPDNILLVDDETGLGQARPVLLDLGAARRVIGGQTHTLTAILKPSFAPIEQYAETVQLRQGPWTDLYALAAVVHFCITGRPPTPATARAVHDDLPTLRQMSHGLASGFDRHFGAPFVNAVDHALAVRPQDRPESVAAWRSELSGLVSRDPVEDRAGLTDHWVPKTVVVRPLDSDLPTGNEGSQTQGFLSTIPAANALHSLALSPAAAPLRVSDELAVTQPAPPSGPVRPAAPVEVAHEDPVVDIDTSEPDPTRATTATVSARARATTSIDVALAGPALNRPAANAPRWIKWAVATLALATASTLMWTQHRGSGGVSASGMKSAMAVPDKLPMAAAVPGTVPAPAVFQARPAQRQAASAGGETDAMPRPTRPTRQMARADAADPIRNPRRACANYSFIALAICMKQRCSRPQYAHHPECERMRRQELAQQTF